MYKFRRKMFINSAAAIGQPLAAQIGEGTFSAAPKCSEQLINTRSHCLDRLGPTNTCAGVGRLSPAAIHPLRQLAVVTAGKHAHMRERLFQFVSRLLFQRFRLALLLA